MVVYSDIKQMLSKRIEPELFANILQLKQFCIMFGLMFISNHSNSDMHFRYVSNRSPPDIVICPDIIVDITLYLLPQLFVLILLIGIVGEIVDGIVGVLTDSYPKTYTCTIILKGIHQTLSKVSNSVGVRSGFGEILIIAIVSEIFSELFDAVFGLLNNTQEDKAIELLLHYIFCLKIHCRYMRIQISSSFRHLSEQCSIKIILSYNVMCSDIKCIQIFII